jgi:Phytochrome region
MRERLHKKSRIVSIRQCENLYRVRRRAKLRLGSVPSDAVLIKLRDWLMARSGETLFATHTLPLLYPPS